MSFEGDDLKKIVNLFGEEKCAPDKILATPMTIFVKNEYMVIKDHKKRASMYHVIHFMLPFLFHASNRLQKKLVKI